MSHQSSSRNHRSNGSNLKITLLIVVLLAVACWLIYQVKHSHHKKDESVENDEDKLSKVVDEIHLGRKGDVGSENVVIVDTNAQGFDHNDINQDEVQLNASDGQTEHKWEERPPVHVLDDSQDGISNNRKKGQSMKNISEDNSDSQVIDGEEALHLPSERESDSSSDDKESSNGEERILEGNEHLKDSGNVESFTSDADIGDHAEATMTGMENISSSADQTEISESAVGENREMRGAEGKQEMSMDDEIQKGNGVDDNSVDSAASDARSNGEHITSTQNDAASSDSENHMEDIAYEFEATRFHNLETDNEASKEGKAENPDDIPSAETKLDNKSPNEASAEEAYDAEGIKNENNEQEISSEPYSKETVKLPENSEGSKVEAEDSQQDDAGNSGKNSFEADSGVKSINEIKNPSVGSEQSHSDNLQKNFLMGHAGEAQENDNEKLGRNSDDGSGSDSCNESTLETDEGETANGEGKKEETSGDEGMKSVGVDEKSNSEDSTNEIQQGRMKARAPLTPRPSKTTRT